MNGLKRIFDGFDLYVKFVIFSCLVVGFVWVSMLLARPYYAQPKANPFKPMELACVDITGKVAAQDNTLKYYRDGGTIVGTDEDNNTYVYTPPQGWVCRFGETKKP